MTPSCSPFSSTSVNARVLEIDHDTVNHSAGEYVRDDVTTNRIEGFWAGLKRQLNGTHHAVSAKHLQRYITEQAFKWNNRSAVGIEDAERANNAIKGAEGKRLMYRRPSGETGGC